MYDPLISKRQQYLLATQLVRAVLKIGKVFIFSVFCVFNGHLEDDVITAGHAED